MANLYWVGPTGTLSTIGHWSTSPGTALFTGTRPTGTNAVLTVTAMLGGTIAQNQLLYDSGGVACGTVGTQITGTPGGVGTYNTTAASRSMTGTSYTMAAGSSVAAAPGTNDTVIFDNNSFFGTAVTVNASASQTVGSINASAITSGANGITLASSGTLTITGGSGTGALITLPTSRFTWTHTGTLNLTGTGTITSNGVSITSVPTINGAGIVVTLVGNFNGTKTLTLTTGTLTLNSYQWICTTFATSSTSSATINSSGSGGGITVTANSGTVINVGKSFAQLNLSSIRPIFTLTASGTAANRTIIWNGTTWQGGGDVMPGFKITNGSDNVTFNLGSNNSTVSLNSLNATGFTGSIISALIISALYIYGDFLAPTSTVNFNTPYYYLIGATGYFSCALLAPSTTTLYIGGAYTQAGPSYGQFGFIVGGTLTLNNTGLITDCGDLTSINLIGDLVFAGYVSLYPQTSNPLLTSITYTGAAGTSSYGNRFNIVGNNISSSLPINITNNSSGVLDLLNLTSSATTITGNTTGRVTLYNVNLTNNPLIFSCGTLGLQSTVNIPASSVFTVTNPSANTTCYLYNGISFSNKIRINIVTSATYTTNLSSDYISANAPDVYISGNGTVAFNDNNYTPLNGLQCNSLDTTAYTGGNLGVLNTDDLVYVDSSLTQSFINIAPLYGIQVIDGSSNVCNINTPSVGPYGLSYAAAGTKIINILSSALNSIISTKSGTSTLKLNSCNLTTLSFSAYKLDAGTSTIISTGTFSVSLLDAGTSTIVLNNGSIGAPSQNFYNVVIAGGINYISAGSINTISNTTQPVTVNFNGNITITNFNLNGTAGNLVTLKSATPFSQTITKSTPWTLANSTNGDNNTGLKFGSSGNNAYLNISYINGVSTAQVPTGNFFLMF